MSSRHQSTLKSHWETLWETLKIYQKKNDKNPLVKIIDKINPLTSNKFEDKRVIVEKCKDILEESNINWIRIRNNQDYES